MKPAPPVTRIFTALLELGDAGQSSAVSRRRRRVRPYDGRRAAHPDGRPRRLPADADPARRRPRRLPRVVPRGAEPGVLSPTPARPPGSPREPHVLPPRAAAAPALGGALASGALGGYVTCRRRYAQAGPESAKVRFRGTNPGSRWK